LTDAKNGVNGMTAAHSFNPVNAAVGAVNADNVDFGTVANGADNALLALTKHRALIREFRSDGN